MIIGCYKICAIARKFLLDQVSEIKGSGVFDVQSCNMLVYFYKCVACDVLSILPYLPIGYFITFPSVFCLNPTSYEKFSPFRYGSNIVYR